MVIFNDSWWLDSWRRHGCQLYIETPIFQNFTKGFFIMGAAGVAFPKKGNLQNLSH